VLDTRRIDGVPRRVCGTADCGFVHWDNPVPAVAGLVQYRDRIVLARNASWPGGTFSLITGFLEKQETPEQAVLRELKEELGLDGEIGGFLGHYPLFATNQLILALWIRATGEIVTGDEIAEVRLLTREELRRWPFGAFALTSAIVQAWLATTPDNP
jgi:NADH pyrophosphatase NudC (nudix superfamily)